MFLFVCGILREEASILFAQIGEKRKSDWNWFKCSTAEANFFIDSWSESGNAEGMANTLCSFMPFPQVVPLPCPTYCLDMDWNLLRVLLFCKGFSKVEAPDEIHLGASYSPPPLIHSSKIRELASLPSLKTLGFFDCFLNVKSALELFQILPDFASLTELTLPDVPEMTDWGIVAEALMTSKTLKKVKCTLLGERGEGWARALDAGLRADSPLSSVILLICGPMSETALQALENLLLNKSLSSVSVFVEGGMSHSLAVTLSRALAEQTAVKFLDLKIFEKLSFCCANLIERGIVKNNSLSNLVFCVHGECPDNWQAIVENLNVRLTEKSTVTFEIYPNTFSQVTATDLSDLRPFVMKHSFFKQESITLNVWSELTVDYEEALGDFLACTWVCHLTLNIHGKLTSDFLHCTARHVSKLKPLYPITINTWNQLTDEGKALFKELELDKNPAFTLNVCDVHVPSDESCDNKIVSIDSPASLIALLEEAENTGKENLTVTINVHSDDSTWDDSDDSTGRSWNDSLQRGFVVNCTLNSLTLTINNFSPRSTGLSPTLIGCLESCISLKSLTLTLNENNKWKDTYASLLCKGLGRNTSLISLTLTLNIFTRAREDIDYFEFDDISDDGFVPNISVYSFTLIINDFSSGSSLGLGSGVLWCNYRSLTTFNLTVNYCDEIRVCSFHDFWDAVMKLNSLRTLRLKIDHSKFTDIFLEYDFSEFIVNIPSLELMELTISCYGSEGSVLETLKWEKQ